MLLAEIRRQSSVRTLEMVSAVHAKEPRKLAHALEGDITPPVREEPAQGRKSAFADGLLQLANATGDKDAARKLRMRAAVAKFDKVKGASA